MDINVLNRKSHVGLSMGRETQSDYKFTPQTCFVTLSSWGGR